MGRLKTLLILFKCLAILTEPTVTTLSHTRLTFRDDEDGDFSGDGALGFDETPVHAPRDFITEVHEQGGDYAASRHHFPRGNSRGKFVHVEMVTPKTVKPENRRSDKKSTLKQTKTGAFVKDASTQRQHIPSQGTVLSQGTNNPRESKTKTPNSNRHKYSQTPENHLFFATQDETLLSMMEAAGGSHRKVIVYNLVPDTLRDRIEKDRRETGQRILPGDMRRAYYDRIANSVHENGRHGAIVFDKDARIEKKWPSEETDSQGVTEFVDGEPLDKDGRESTDRQEHSWPSFRSLLKTRGKVESKDRALTKEESVKKGAWSIRKEVESVDEDYQSDSYHRRVPEIDDYLDMEIEGEGDGVPRFLKDLMNISIPIGKEIVLSCAVVQLGNHKVGWIRLDDQTVLSLGDRIVTNNHRIKISTYQNRHFQLHIHQAAKSDAGCYMCQVNTVVMMKQIGCVDIKTTPDIDNENSPSDVAVAEYDNATLYCVATGNPMPSIVWSRDGNREVIIKSPNSSDIERVEKYNGTYLHLYRADRRQMGYYTCTADNGVPPAVTKRVSFVVHFEPKVIVPVQMIGTPLGGDVTFDCYTEGYPDTINYWCRNENPQDVIMNGTKHTVIQTRDPLDKWKLSLVLTIRNVSDKDLGIYTCESTNSLGKTTANVRVYEITGIELEQYNQAKKKASVINTNVTSSGSGRYLAGIGHTTSSVVSLGLLVWLWFSGAGF